MQVHFRCRAFCGGYRQLSVPLAELSSATLGALIEHLDRSLEGTTPSGLTLAAGHGAVPHPGQWCPF